MLFTEEGDMKKVVMAAIAAMVVLAVSACSSDGGGGNLTTDSKVKILMAAMQGASAAAEADKEQPGTSERSARTLEDIEWKFEETYPNELGGSVTVTMDMRGTYDPDTRIENVSGTEVDAYSGYTVKLDGEPHLVTGTVRMEVTQKYTPESVTSDSTSSGSVSLDGESTDFDVTVHAVADLTKEGNPSTARMKGTLGGETVDMAIDF
jgi:hypothetical protein